MTFKRNVPAIAILCISAFVSSASVSQEISTPSPTQAPFVSKKLPIPMEAIFRPGLDDLMTMIIQPRHNKLFFAGVRKNWELAASEERDLRHAFGRIVQYMPKYQGLDVSEAILTMIDPAFDKMDRALASGDPILFASAYQDVTTACNACHAYMEHPYHVIKVPAVSATSMYPDQEFSATTP